TDDVETEILAVITRSFRGCVWKIPIAITRHVDLLEDGDAVQFVEGGIEVSGIECRHVVSAFIRKQGKLLLLKRSEKVGSFRGRWATVSGYIEEGDTPLSRARLEIMEETGIRKAVLLKKGEVVLARSGNRVFAVHPFLFETNEEVILDWEHSEYRWIQPMEIDSYNTVPKLKEALRKVL
ncbi:MAG: NUDIX domain-containing protein, partial [Thermoplasmata archaeon]